VTIWMYTFSDYVKKLQQYKKFTYDMHYVGAIAG
jgi:hypothetical protein